MRSIRELKNRGGGAILLRAGFDVPTSGGRVRDASRIETLAPTMKFLLGKGPLVILSHQGRPHGRSVEALSLRPLLPVLDEILSTKTKFSPSCVGSGAEAAVRSLQKGEVLLLENLRFHSGEENNDPSFSRALARLGGTYVNDAFSDAHRAHASIVGLPKHLPSFAGFRLLKEVKFLSRARGNIRRPFLVVLGGAKLETKIPLIEKYLKLADFVFVGGALANDFLKSKGWQVGKSMVDGNVSGIKPLLNNKKLFLPIDVLVKTPRGTKTELCRADGVKNDEMIVDIGEESARELVCLVNRAKTILWNGPLGKTDDGGIAATKKIARAIARSNALSIATGGDTEEAISDLGLEKKFSFISTGGGSALQFLVSGTLPGIKALE